ncbi:uncharacterized protein MYCFIDRAFT_175524 [Pseudocercospora fijiensis CIRAD86]|uniref:Uncharacterized protein n=1 Tax=Pseudocercospora fijiensis (strain CIRAD86) TaxID=383855 RepID=M2ZSF2_PSEFD|nr:uncharacterized protein MYCFIDRAFT_175524 [Pseudocercospora fijiensis CIRAD86]EME81949.1 hypothetical protein MYCFIDRAFT_175524 [Pseudocercospora fijiensis CIRAD86]
MPYSPTKDLKLLARSSKSIYGIRNLTQTSHQSISFKLVHRGPCSGYLGLKTPRTMLILSLPGEIQTSPHV